MKDITIDEIFAVLKADLAVEQSRYRLKKAFPEMSDEVRQWHEDEYAAGVL